MTQCPERHFFQGDNINSDRGGGRGAGWGVGIHACTSMPADQLNEKLAITQLSSSICISDKSRFRILRFCYFSLAPYHVRASDSDIVGACTGTIMSRTYQA